MAAPWGDALHTIRDLQPAPLPLAAPQRSTRDPRWALAGIVILAVALRVWRLDASSFIVPYYFAGVRSMLESWHNFFFNAFDPAGFISLDKPPVAFWLQTAGAKALGFGAPGILLPQVAEGTASILVLYALVRRHFGAPAALLAALFLALTPLSVAVDRSNNTESCLILVLLLAAWAFDRAMDRPRTGTLLLSATLVGIAFNIKMLVAFGIVPVLVLLYLAAGPGGWRQRLGRLILAGAVMAAVSLSWSVAYDLTPPDARPYAGSTDDNSMLQLTIGHNGTERFIRRARPDRPATTHPPFASSALAGRDFAPAGPLRLAAPPLAAQIGWLFPIAVIGAAAAWIMAPKPRRERFPLALPGGIVAWLQVPGRAAERQWLLLWAGWTIVYGTVFSAAGGLFHTYYIAVMAPAVCALAGIGGARLWQWHRAGGRPAIWLAVAIAATALWQARIVDFYLGGAIDFGRGWLLPSFTTVACATAAALAALHRRTSAAAAAIAGFALLLLLSFPAVWCSGAALGERQTGFPAARPPFLTAEAETGRWRVAHLAGALTPDPRLLAYLQQRVTPGAYLLATANTRQAAPFIIATGAPVMAFGGFSGRDPAVSAADFERLVAAGRVRFALIGDGGPGIRRAFGEGGQAAVVVWIRANGRLVDPGQWRSGPYPVFGGRESRPTHPAETVGAELYDLHPATDAGTGPPRLP